METKASSAPQHEDKELVSVIRRNAPAHVKMIWLRPDEIPALLQGKLRLSRKLPADVRYLYCFAAPERMGAWGICIESGEFDGVTMDGRPVPDLENAWEWLREETDEWITY